MVTSPLQYSYKVAARYEDGYRTGRTLVRVGRVIRWIGVCIGVFIAILSLLNGPHPVLLAAVIPISMVCMTGWALGTLIEGAGHLLRVNIDTAIQSSPFLTEDQRAKVMSLD